MINVGVVCVLSYVTIVSVLARRRDPTLAITIGDSLDH